MFEANASGPRRGEAARVTSRGLCGSVSEARVSCSGLVPDPGDCALGAGSWPALWGAGGRHRRARVELAGSRRQCFLGTRVSSE